MPPSLAIVLPTYNRVAHLRTCLAHLERQTTLASDSEAFELLLVDDGSSDATASTLAVYCPPFPIRILHQPNTGPARARNLALAHTLAPLVLFLGDDTFAAPDLVATHLAFHRMHPEPHAAALGLIRWATEGQAVTPLMRWLELDGVQFAYRALFAGEPPTWAHFYTSNLSLKTAFLGPSPFNETFHAYGLEDTELGYRLSQARNPPLHLHFLPNAIVDHLHPITLPQSCRRALQIGAAQHRFAQLWPEQRPALPPGLKGILLRALASRPMLPIFTAITRALTALHCPNPFLPRLLHCYRLRGFCEAANVPKTTERPRLSVC